MPHAALITAAAVATVAALTGSYTLGHRAGAHSIEAATARAWQQKTTELRQAMQDLAAGYETDRTERAAYVEQLREQNRRPLADPGDCVRLGADRLRLMRAAAAGRAPAGQPGGTVPSPPATPQRQP